MNTTILFNLTGYFTRFFNLSNTNMPVDRSRFIALKFKPTDNVGKLHLNFEPDSKLNTTLGSVTKRPDSTIDIKARLPLSEFAAYIDILRYEKPLLVWVTFDSNLTVNGSKQIVRFDFGIASPEPLGEGPVDTSVPDYGH